MPVQAITKIINKAAHRFTPASQRHRPFLRGRLFRHPHHLFNCIISREYPAFFNGMPDLQDDTVRVINGTDRIQWAILPFGDLFH